MRTDSIKIDSISSNDLKDSFFTVLSVELGNTTIKSVIITFDFKSKKNYQLIKLVRLTRNIRDPLDNEEIFGQTIWNKPLSKEAIQDEVTSIIKEALEKTNLKVSNLDFVVRSTGVVAIKSLSDNIGKIIKALSEGCLNAGIKPSQMTAPFSKNNIPEHIRSNSFINNIQFDGSVVSVSSLNSGVTSNEMESELVTAGIKLGSINSTIDYRNPVISIDMGTTLAGQVINNNKPYANSICNYVGMAGSIADVLLRGSKNIQENQSAIDIQLDQNNTQFNKDIIQNNTLKIHKYIDIIEVPHDVYEFGQVNVSCNLYNNSDLKLIGSRINDYKKITQTFNDSVCNFSNAEVLIQIDDIFAYFIKRLINKTQEILPIDDDITVGITGRAALTGRKQEFICEYLKDESFDIIFVEDGLAHGAVMMARCMNSLGTPTRPIGGSKHGMCIMQDRIFKNKKK